MSMITDLVFSYHAVYAICNGDSSITVQSPLYYHYLLLHRHYVFLLNINYSSYARDKTSFVPLVSCERIWMCKLERVESPSERNSFSENEWNSFLLQMEQNLNVDARSVDQGTRFRRSSNERYIVKSTMYLYFWQKRVCNYKIGLRTWNYWYEVSRFCQSVIMHNSVLIFGWDI